MGKDNARARITVKVQPRAKTTRISGRMEHVYRLHLAAPPVDGKANGACIAFLAEIARVPKSKVRIISGLTSRMKMIEVEGINQTDLERLLSREP